VGALFGGDDIGLQRPGLVEAAEGAVHRGVAHVVETGGAQAADDVVPVPVLVPHHRQHGQVEHPLEELCGVHAPPFSVLHGTTESVVVEACQPERR
jgi:hypothetical protein